MMILLCILGWLACAIFTAGAFFADIQDSFPMIAKVCERQDLAFGLVLGLIGGPIGALVSIFLTGFFQHGWRLRNSPK